MFLLIGLHLLTGAGGGGEKQRRRGVGVLPFSMPSVSLECDAMMEQLDVPPSAANAQEAPNTHQHFPCGPIPRI